MNNNANSRFRLALKQYLSRLPVLFLCAVMPVPWAAGSDVGGDETQGGKLSAESGPNHSTTAGNPSLFVTVSKPSISDSKPAAPAAPDLAGCGAGEVEAALGKPSGKLQTAQGALWLYAKWRVQFDHNGRAVKIEKDQPVHLAKVDPRFVAASEALAKAAVERAAADDAARARAAEAQVAKIRVVSNRGQQVDLAALLVPGKVTIVDFYAEWCGPCRQLGPHLEQLAKEDPDVVLLKIDIFDWNTPVTQQFGINSVPNVRVFNPAKTQIGDGTYDLTSVQERIRQAKKS